MPDAEPAWRKDRFKRLQDPSLFPVKYEMHDVFIPPSHDGATIWRYMDFTKFVSLLDTSSLYFARCDTLGDRFEGSLPTVNHLTREFNQMPDQIEFAALTRQLMQAMVRSTFANCWNLSEGESAALWSIYTPSTGGVAIKSTYGDLRDCFGPIEKLEPSDGVVRLRIGRVRYVDYDVDSIPDSNIFYRFTTKRQSFEFEHELRAVIQVGPEPVDGVVAAPTADIRTPEYVGVPVAVDLERLIETVHVSPEAPVWFAELVRSVVKRYGLDPERVQQSSMSGEPLY